MPAQFYFSRHLMLDSGQPMCMQSQTHSWMEVRRELRLGQTISRNHEQSRMTPHSQFVRGIVRRNSCANSPVQQNHKKQPPGPCPCWPETLWLRPLLEKTETKRSEGGECLVPQGLRTNFQFRCLQMLKIPLSKGGQGRSEDPKTCVVLCSYTLG